MIDAIIAIAYSLGIAVSSFRSLLMPQSIRIPAVSKVKDLDMGIDVRKKKACLCLASILCSRATSINTVVAAAMQVVPIM